MRAQKGHIGILMAVTIVAMTMNSCQKYIEFEGENKTPRLVINAAIQADSVFGLNLSHSLGYVDIGQISGIANGVVNVYNGNGQFLETLDHIGDGHYRGEQIALAGQAYRVTASAAGYSDVFAVDLVPPVVEIADWDTSHVESSSSYGSMSWNVSFQINDPGGVDNYYMIEAFEMRTYDLIFIGYDPEGFEIYDTIFLAQPQGFSLSMVTGDLVLTSEYDTGLGEVEVYGRRFLFTDELFEGGLRQFDLKVEHVSASGQLELRLTSCSADLFQYYRTFERYQSSSGDPFSEPVQVFSNIEGGGLGIWGGRSTHVVSIGL